jgi:hypothetical protein
VPPVSQVGDVILDRNEVKQVFTGGAWGWSIAFITAIWLGPGRQVPEAGGRVWRFC